ncbi:MAG: hypothetical protein IPH07_33090 [Deltaproteobacteria bacterium]|nr:hypothetical protein [Deltaproteobacteria bacterium]MBK8235018.1 hypothetical protein [Deltaproteobacteria bacterium]MBK8716670.1 hypothetical protein [Deltaproteobacteria bacterium]MBP7285363.1 hypothetical protein [Nannocystaceae bacterium]
MTLRSLGLALFPLSLALACDGKIPLGEGESSSGDIDTDDSASASASETGAGSCTPVDDEPTSSMTTVRLTNALATPVVIAVVPFCPANDYYQIESSEDELALHVESCGNFCDQLGQPWECQAGCINPNDILILPGGSHEFEPWDGRLWESRAVPDACGPLNTGECFHGVAASGPLQMTVWFKPATEDLCDGTCECADGEDSCVFDQEDPGFDLEPRAWNFDASDASVDVVLE